MMEKKKSIIKAFNLNKYNAPDKAREVRTEQVKSRIKKAIDYIKRSGQKMTQKNIAEISKCSVNTVRKYSHLWIR